LPWEDPAAFEATVDIFKTGLGTRNPLEEKLAQDAALASWQADRANRCGVARIKQNVMAQSEAVALREEKEALALGNRLMHDSAGVRCKGSKREKRRMRREMLNKELEKRAARKSKALDEPIDEVIESVKWLLPNTAKVLRDHYSRSP
jgi:hypothetical protein